MLDTEVYEFHENPSHGSRVVPCGRTDRQTGMTKVIVAFRNFENAHLNDNYILLQKHEAVQISAPEF